MATRFSAGEGADEPRVRLTLFGHRCERCGHEWEPSGMAKPRVCPQCKSRHWSTPRRIARYDLFKVAIERVLREAGEPMTWTEIRASADLHQKFPNNRWVRQLEADIGLVRERVSGRMAWRLSKPK